MSGKAGFVRTILFALGANLAIAVTKSAAAFFTGSSAIGVVLIVVAAGIAVQIKDLLIGQSAEPQTVARVQEFLGAQPEIARVYRILTLQLGNSLMVAVKARMKAETTAQLIADINTAEAALRAEFPEIQWLFFEPDEGD